MAHCSAILVENTDRPVPKLQDLRGQRFGRLVVLRQAESYVQKNGNSFARWYCLCDCGKETVTHALTLKSGACKSCGCLLSEYASKSNLLGHRKDCYFNRTLELNGEVKTIREWAVITGFSKELLKHRKFRYGWSDEETLTLPIRSKNRDDFSKFRDTSNAKTLTFQGRTQKIGEWGKELGINQITIRSRLVRGATTEEALTRKVMTPEQATKYMYSRRHLNAASSASPSDHSVSQSKPTSQEAPQK